MGPPVMTLWAVQIVNVAEEEARHLLNEMYFSYLSRTPLQGASAYLEWV